MPIQFFRYANFAAALIVYIIGNPASAQGNDPKIALNYVDYSVAGSLIVVFIFLFYLLLNWARKKDSTAYLGRRILDSIQEFEYNRLVRVYIERWERGDYHRHVAHELQQSRGRKTEPAPPTELGAHLRRDPGHLRRDPGGYSNAWEFYGNGGPTAMPGLPTSRTGGLGGSRPTFARFDVEGSYGIAGLDDFGYYLEKPIETLLEEKPELKEELNEFLIDLHDFQISERQWAQDVESEALSRYESDKKYVEKQATDRAESAVDIDFAALRRGGGQFVLEFTAIVVIIFAALILGVLQRLTPEIGALLAAIAGYVLGRSSTRGDESSRSSEVSSDNQSSRQPQSSTGSGAGDH